ncbi:MAG: hypothetical protein ACOY32_10000 [Thermodesulfobacteriota bacterium]
MTESGNQYNIIAVSLYSSFSFYAKDVPRLSSMKNDLNSPISPAQSGGFCQNDKIACHFDKPNRLPSRKYLEIPGKNALARQ